MKLLSVHSPRRSAAGFTMVEIALSLAVIGFALVAIIGVLPTGLNVQKENRERTIIDHDANFLIDAIRSGSRGADDLTNYVYAITNYWAVYDIRTDPWTEMVAPAPANYDGYVFNNAIVTSEPGAEMPIDTGFRIVGVLSRPRFENLRPGFIQSNYVVGYARAMSGAATEKFPQTDPSVRDLAFAYRFTVELANLTVPAPPPGVSRAFNQNLIPNVRELRLLFRWPLLPAGKTGNGREVYRTQTGGRLLKIDDVTGHPLYYLEPAVYQHR